MLTSLEIKNFRTFSHLFIERLGRVNLILGKNNVGKTTLLEALRLYGSIWPPPTVMSILDGRDEIARLPNGEGILLLHSLFHGRDPQRGDAIVIGEVGDHEGAFSATADFEVEPAGQSDEATGYSPVERPRLGMTSGRLNCHVDWEGRWGYMIARGTNKFRVPEPPHDPPYLRSIGLQKELQQTMADWWDAVSLSEGGESRVVDAMQPVALVRKVRFVSDGRKNAGRKPVAKVEGYGEPIPLASLGDGVVRMFQLAVVLEYAAVYAKHAADGEYRTNMFPFVLIDEVESGIHHTLHADLWRFIFRTARLLDVQVFATTHSWDCLKGFAEAIAEDEENDGLAVRLEKVEGEEQTGAVIVDREGLPIVVRNAIEVR